MRGSTIAVMVLAGLAAAPAARAEKASDAALARAARDTVLADIDWNGAQCDRRRTIGAWLAALTAHDAGTIRWYGGACRLADPGNPIDRGKGPCGGAEITLKAPRSRDDTATIEIYFEPAAGGKPGRPFAFRGVMQSADGWDYTRWSADFEADWLGRFPDATAARCGAAE